MADTDLIERVNVIAGLLVLSPEQSEALMDAATALAEKDARIAELRNLVDRLRLEAQIHAGEARGANATIHEAYQAVTEGKGEPGNWNGAVPIKEELARLRAQLTASRAECEGLRAALRQITEIVPSSNCDAGSMARSRMKDIALLALSRAALSQKETGHE